MFTIEKKKVSAHGWRILFRADKLATALDVYYMLKRRFPYSKYRVMFSEQSPGFTLLPINVTGAARKEKSFQKVS